jgi:hypothetical protein
MRFWLFLIIFGTFVTPALAAGNATIFPPVTTQNQECGNDQLRVLSWAKDTTSTVCLTGQEVMSLALPGCTTNQQIVYDGNRFACRSPVTIPTCQPNEYLSFNGTDYTCRSNSPPPTCTSEQVLTFDGRDYICVNRQDDIPTCRDDQRLTYNGQQYQCATIERLTLPVCAAGTVLTSNGTALRCTAAAKPTLSCRVVMAQGLGPSFVSVAACNADEFLLNGGGITHPDLCGGKVGYLHTSMPEGNSWKVDGFEAYTGAAPAGDICTQAFATCCKFQ